MPPDEELANERRPLLSARGSSRRFSRLTSLDARSIVTSSVSKEDAALGESTVGERLPYNDYATIDWLHDLVRTS